MIRKLFITLAAVICISWALGSAIGERISVHVNARASAQTEKISVADMDEPHKIAGYAIVLYHVNRSCGNFDAAGPLLMALADFYATQEDGGMGTPAGDRVHNRFIQRFLFEEIAIEDSVIQMVAPSCDAAEEQTEAALEALEAVTEQMVGIEI